MEEDIKVFLEHLAREEKCSSNTLAAYDGDLNQLSAYVKSQCAGQETGAGRTKLNVELISGYMLSLKERKYAPSTVARKTAAAKSFLRFMVERGRLKDDLSASLASPRVNKGLPKALTISEVRRLLSEPAKISTPEAKRDRTMFELIYATGMKASEVVALNVRDVDTRAGNVRCYGRGSSVRVIPIDRYVAQTVKQYIDNGRVELLSNEEEPALFLNRRGLRLTRQGFWQIIQGYADRAGFDFKVTPRLLRHSFAVHKLKSGADLESLKELLGHAHLSTTRAYTQVSLNP